MVLRGSERGLLSSCGVQASDCGGFSVAEHGLWGVRAQELWCRGLVTPRHVESSQSRIEPLYPA